jgi:hypothetical protein
MVQESGVLTREGGRISLVSAGRTVAQENYPTITETVMLVNTIEPVWTCGVGEEIPVRRTTPRSVKTPAKIMSWRHLHSLQCISMNLR